MTKYIDDERILDNIMFSLQLGMHIKDDSVIVFYAPVPDGYDLNTIYNAKTKELEFRLRLIEREEDGNP